MQKQAKSIRSKIANLRHHSPTKQNDAEIEQLKESLQELVRRIQHTQTKEQLQAKVAFILEPLIGLNVSLIFEFYNILCC